MQVALVFGASIMSPREVVIVDFNETMTIGKEDALENDGISTSPAMELSQMASAISRTKLMQLCTQKLMRAVFTHAMEHFASALAATKLHVAVLAKRQPARLPGFIPKQHFKLRLPKKKWTPRIVICDGVKSLTIKDRMSDNNFAPGTGKAQLPTFVATHDPEYMWYVLEKPVPGFSNVLDA